jgi:hypothetical protein
MKSYKTIGKLKYGPPPLPPVSPKKPHKLLRNKWFGLKMDSGMILTINYAFLLQFGAIMALEQPNQAKYKDIIAKGSI